MDIIVMICALLQAAVLVWTANFGIRYARRLNSRGFRRLIALMIFAGANLGWLLPRMAG